MKVLNNRGGKDGVGFVEKGRKGVDVLNALIDGVIQAECG